jgi:ATP-dependent helicase/nuclease subunit B
MKKLYYGSFANKKREELVNECIGFIKNDLKVVYILPSREAMFQVRRLFAERLGGISNCWVMGFDNLERLILAGSLDQSGIMSELEKSVIIKDVLGRLPIDDTVFEKVKDKPGFIRLLTEIIRLLKRSNILPGEFFQIIQSLEGNLFRKCKSIYNIYHGYEEFKTQKGLMDIDDISLKAAEACVHSRIFKDIGIIVIDGFINIDPVNLELVKKILHTYPDIPVYVNVPFKNTHNQEFVLGEIIKSFEELGFERIEVEEKDDTVQDNQLHTICHALYSGSDSIIVNPETLYISSSPCLDHEIRAAAGRIKQLIANAGITPSDIAVVAADTEKYRTRLIEVFTEYGIPLNAKKNDVLLSVPLVKDIAALWRMAYYDDEWESAFVSIVTSKYLLPWNVLAHENYGNNRLFETAVNVLSEQHDDYFEAFLNSYLGEVDDDSSRMAMENYINTVRAFVNGFEDLGNAVELFKEILKAGDIENNILRMYEIGLLDADLWLRDITALYKTLDFFEGLHRIYKDYQPDAIGIEAEGLVQQILSGLSVYETDDFTRDQGGVRFIPPDLLRGQSYDTVFILGLNEGVFPRKGDTGDLFDSYEMRRLFELSINLRPAEWELEREKLRFNSCMASARNRLYLSFRTADEDASIMIASPFIDEVMSVLDTDSRKSIIAKPVSMRERMEFRGEPFSTGEMIRKINLMHIQNALPVNNLPVTDEITDRLKYPLHAASVEFAREFESEFNEYDGKLNQPKIKQQGLKYTFSASQINRYARCPFLYFAERVLDVDPEDDTARRRMDVGIFYHNVIKVYYERCKDPRLPDIERLHDIFDNLAEYLDLTYLPPSLRVYALEELRQVLERFIRHDAENMARYNEVTGCILKPIMLEERFVYKLDGDRAVITGIADRVDLEIDSDGHFTGRFIIYDYKKGSINGIKECISGDDFQLPLYFSAFKNILKEAFGIPHPECLALLYYSIEKLNRDGIIRNDIKKALFEGKKGTKSTPEKANMELVLSWAEQEAVKVIEKIRQGYFMPPRECPKGIFGCIYDNMCRYDRARLARKAGV